MNDMAFDHLDSIILMYLYHIVSLDYQCLYIDVK